MAEVGSIAAGLPSIDGYPNGVNKQAVMMLAMFAGMDVFMVISLWFVAGVMALPGILFILGTTIGFAYFTLRSQYFLAPVRVGVSRAGLRFIYRNGNEEEIIWSRISNITTNFGGRPGSAAAEVVDRFIPVVIPIEVVERAAPLLEEDEKMAEGRSTAEGPDPATRAAKTALHGKNNGRKLLILMGASFPFIILMAVATMLLM